MDKILSDIDFIRSIIYFYFMWSKSEFTEKEIYLIEEKFGKNAPKKGILRGYKMALNDVSTMVEDLNNSDRSRFLDDFHKEFGKSFYSVAVDPKRIIKKVLARGRIINEYEFNFVKDHIGNIIETKNFDKLSIMVEKFDT